MKLYCTFCIEDTLNTTTETIKNSYNVLNNKIFVLSIDDSNELLVTYNTDQFNMSEGLIQGTILLHRKKEFNTLYSLNALNDLIKQLNNGKLDPNYQVDWNNYRNSLLLTKDNIFKQSKTKLYNIISF